MSRTGRRPHVRLQRFRVVVSALVAALGLGVLGATPAWAHDWVLTQPDITIGEGLEFSGVVSCIQPSGAGGSYDTSDFTGTIDWGDGTTTSATIAFDFDSFCFIDVRGTHTYAVAGVYDLFVSVQDLTLDGHRSFGYQGTATVTVRPNDLSVGLAATPNPAKTGKNLTYTATVQNGSNNVASGVSATLTLPPQVQFVSMTSTTAVCLAPPVGSTGSITCSLGQMTGNASWTLRVTTKVMGGGKAAIQAGATVAGSDPDPFTANNSATVATSISGRR